MDKLTFLQEIDLLEWFIILVGIVSAGVFLYKLFIEDIIKKHGWESAKMRQRREDHELLKKVTELAKTTAENLAKLQERHTKDEEEFRNNLNNYIEESRKDRKTLHDEMGKFTNNRVNDRQQSLQIQKELTDSIKELTNSQKERDEKLETLTTMFLSKEIDDMRWEILDFCSALSNGRKYNREAFDHVLRIYDKYEKILEENDMENGLVEQSIKFVQDSYYEGLKNGTIK